MSMARLVITAVTIEGRSKSEVARDYGVSRVWVQNLVRRFHSEGEAAFEPRSRRPHSSPHAVDADTEDVILRLRKELSKQGLDAGAGTIAAHLARQAPPGGGRPVIPAVSTIWRILFRRGFVRPQPQKRPRSSWRTFCADQPNERWQADITQLESSDVIANRLDVACCVKPQATMTGCAQPDAHPSEERFAVEVVEVALIQRCCVDAHQHLVVLDNRTVDVPELENTRWAVLCPDEGLHGVPRFSGGTGSVAAGPAPPPRWFSGSGRVDQVPGDSDVSSGRDRRRIGGGRASCGAWGSHPYHEQVEDHPDL
jgi:transposase-like protein